ncbi:two-component system response regulator [Escherichia coli]|uniref:Two-component system response regulator n=1 Tax=Escherichia coli TaxID=562 RepID=A0A377DBF1_ECOLX|nr:two-component system response regulator [Escherichia coli]
MITVALIDDHLIVRSGFAQLLGLEPDLQVVAEFGSGREALAGLPGRGCAGVYLRYLHARYLRSGAAKPAAERYGDDYALRS